MPMDRRVGDTISLLSISTEFWDFLPSGSKHLKQTNKTYIGSWHRSMEPLVRTVGVSPPCLPVSVMINLQQCYGSALSDKEK